MRRVIAAVKAAGGTDVKTQSVSLSPRYNERNEVQAFVATNTVSATIKEIAKAGALIDAAVDAGANQVYGPSLSRGDQSELYRNALKAAVADARASAQALASASNLSLGPHHRDRRGRRRPAADPLRRREGDGRRLDADRARHAAGQRGRLGHVLRLVAPATDVSQGQSLGHVRNGRLPSSGLLL